MVSVIVFGAGLALFMYFFDYPFASVKVEQAARDYQQVGLPWEATDIQAIPAVKSTENAAPRIIDALSAFDNDRFSSDREDIDRLFYRGRYREALTLLATHQKALNLARQASERPRLDFGRDWDLGGYLQVPEPALQKQMAQALGMRAQVLAGLGNTEAALDDLASAQRLSLLIGDEPMYLALLVRIGAEMTFLASTLECAHLWRNNAVALRKLQSILRQPQKPLDVRRVMMSEAYATLASLRNMDLDDNDAPPPRVLTRRGLPRSMKSRAYTARFMEMWVEAKPVIDRHGDDLRKMGEELSKLHDRWNTQISAANMYNTMLLPYGTGLWKPVFEVLAKRRAVQALLHCLLFRIENGRYPATRNEIAANWIDPFTNRPLILKRAGSDVCVYSVGRDKVDSGGIHYSRDWPRKSGDDVSASCRPVRSAR